MTILTHTVAGGCSGRLDPVNLSLRRNHLVAVALAGMALLAVAGWGWIHDSEEDKVRSAINEFADAVRASDFNEICEEHITNSLKEQVQTLGECPKIVERATKVPGFDPSFSVEIRSVDVTGDRAAAAVETIQNGRKRESEMNLAKEGDGRWRLATLQ